MGVLEELQASLLPLQLTCSRRNLWIFPHSLQFALLSDQAVTGHHCLTMLATPPSTGWEVRFPGQPVLTKAAPRCRVQPEGKAVKRLLGGPGHRMLGVREILGGSLHCSPLQPPSRLRQMQPPVLWRRSRQEAPPTSIQAGSLHIPLTTPATQSPPRTWGFGEVPAPLVSLSLRISDRKCTRSKWLA